MKKLVTALLCATTILGITGCGSKEGEAPKEKVFIEDSEIANLYTNPKNYTDKYVNLTGKVFSTPEQDEDIIAFQMWQDSQNADRNTIVGCDLSVCKDIKANDYVKITGYVRGEFEGENMLGGKIKAPQIFAESVEKSSYMDVVAPTIKSIDVNKTVEQNGVTMSVSKVEFADNETRVYLSVDNQSGSKFSFYSFDAKVTQGSSQYEEDMNYEADYPEINSEILNGIKSEGILVYPKLEQSSFTLITEGHTDDYNVDFTDFVFDITI